MQRLRKTVLVALAIATPAAAHVYFALQSRCFTDGTTTYQLAAARTADFRARISDKLKQPDLRIRLLDSPELADFVLVDDGGGGQSSCRTAGILKTIVVDNNAALPDVTVGLTRR